NGIARIASRINALATSAATSLRAAGLSVLNDIFFDTVAVTAVNASELVDKAKAAGINIRLVNADTISFSVDETTTVEILSTLLSALGANFVFTEGGTSLAAEH
ncbi:hypothetical protein, partial [Salmonella enterica]|uniref:hypothetical protein n=1 Tax=Salmonella enterica TaxID=28901 RepID=UPI00352398BC